MPTFSASPTVWMPVFSKARAMGQQHSAGAHCWSHQDFPKAQVTWGASSMEDVPLKKWRAAP